MYRAIWASIIFTAAYFISFFLVLVFACNPIDAAWKSLNIEWTDKYTCLDRHQLDPLNGVFSIFSDVYSMAIPVAIVARLSVPMSRKIVLYAIFCCSLIVLGASIARTIWLSRLYTDPRRDLTCKFSISLPHCESMLLISEKGVGYDLLVWSSLEMQLAIICASAPAMKGFFTGLASSVTTRYGSRSGGSNNHRTDQYPLDSASSVLIQNSSSYSAGKHASHTLAPVEFRSKWDDEAHTWYPNKSNYEMSTLPGKRQIVPNDHVLVTETFTIDRSIVPSQKEGRFVGT
jgi:hypothetical protein